MHHSQRIGGVLDVALLASAAALLAFLKLDDGGVAEEKLLELIDVGAEGGGHEHRLVDLGRVAQNSTEIILITISENEISLVNDENLERIFEGHVGSGNVGGDAGGSGHNHIRDIGKKSTGRWMSAIIVHKQVRTAATQEVHRRRA